MKVTGKVINHVPCLVYVYNNIHYAIAINGNGLIGIW